MTPDLDKRLRSAWPLVFPVPLMNDEPIRTGDGWFTLLWELCHDLELLIASEPEAERIKYRAQQVKEKFGGLRFYLAHETPTMTAVMAAAEYKSDTICDVCGKPGRHWSGDGVESPMLVRTRCEEHKNWFERGTGFAHATESKT